MSNTWHGLHLPLPQYLIMKTLIAEKSSDQFDTDRSQSVAATGKLVPRPAPNFHPERR